MCADVRWTRSQQLIWNRYSLEIFNEKKLRKFNNILVFIYLPKKKQQQMNVSLAQLHGKFHHLTA